MSLERRYGSRFRQTEAIITPSGFTTFGIMKKFKFLDRNNLDISQIGKITITGDLVGRADLIAYEVYKRSDLDWVITMFNHVINPFKYPKQWPEVNQVVEYPISSVVLPEL